MKNLMKFTKMLTMTAVFIGLVACAGLDRQGQGTLLGAGAGALGGAALSNGGALGTIGGAAVGGVIGHEVTKPK